ncbi:MAG: M50 family metallopeptidase [Lachnospiraceae bacterium]|nr:M50 family metallopeptidase [Lachnospiraceae bacterium]
MEKKKSKVNMMSVASMIALMVSGWVAGIEGVEISRYLFGEDGTAVNNIIICMLAVVIMFTMMFVHLVIHEAGHLIFGLISGYDFSSFRVGNIIILKDNGKLKIKKYSIPGTGGQCIMLPPKDNGDEIPYVLYNLGGVLINLITAILALIVLLVFGGNAIVDAALKLFIVVGVACAILNGVPMSSSQLDNDGKNIITLKKNPKARKAFANTFSIFEKITEGKRLREIPEELFEIEMEDKIEDSISASVIINKFMRLIDLWKLEEAMNLGEYILEHVEKIAGVHKNIVKQEMVYCMIMLDYPREKIDEMYKDKELNEYLKMAANMISTPRIQYVYSLFVEQDEKKAKKHYDNFYKIMKSYPYEVDKKTEEEMLLKAKEHYSNKESK